LLGDEFNQLGGHVAAGAGFVSNFVLWREAGYFDNSSETKPLLHLWSLGVEEQFYLVWPLVLWVAWRRGLNLSLVIIILALLSFVLNVKWVGRYPVAAFYSPQTRFWELLCGGVLAWISLRRDYFVFIKNKTGNFRLLNRWFDVDRVRKLRCEFLSLSGVVFLLIGFLSLGREDNFPGWLALFPVLGSVLVIAAGSDAWINRVVLSNRVLVWFGLISFPLYLWHWPILSFGQIFYFETPPLKFRVAAIFVSIALAWLTFRFVERPFRFGDRGVGLKVAVLCGTIFGLGILGVFVNKADFSQSLSFQKMLLKRRGEHAIGGSLSWFHGKDGWLFLGNAYENTVAKLKMVSPPSKEQVDAVKQTFSRIAETSAGYGVRVFLIMGPDKTSVYPEYLPNEITPSKVKYSSFF